MVTLYRASACKIAEHRREHGAPHFHIKGPGYRCSVAIEALVLIVGAVPTSVFREAVTWARENQTVLMQTWQELNG